MKSMLATLAIVAFAALMLPSYRAAATHVITMQQSVMQAASAAIASARNPNAQQAAQQLDAAAAQLQGIATANTTTPTQPDRWVSLDSYGRTTP